MRKTTFLLIFGLLSTFLTFSAQSAFACDYSKGTITSISPQTVRAGDILTITGSGFGTINQYWTQSGPQYDKEIYFHWFLDSEPNIRRSGGSFGGRLNDGIDNYISWTDSEIKIQIPSNFEQKYSGVINALNENINKFHLYVVRYPFARQGSLPNGTPLYVPTPEGNYEVCSNPADGTNATFYYQPSCSADEWTCGDWNTCEIDSQQTRACTKTLDCPLVDTPSPNTTQSCTYVPPTCNSWDYSDWNTCSENREQTRFVTASYPDNCTGGNPALSQSCTYTPPACTSWTYSDWSSCSVNGQQTRSVTASSPENCTGGNPVLNQSCTYVPPTCTSWTYSDWSSCGNNGQKTRSILTSSPTNCTGGSSVLSQSCTYTPPAPTCTTDTWECEEWNSCSPSGIQSRSCTKTFDCPNVQTAAPATDQFCTAPRPTQPPSSQSDEISNQDTIVKATVKLLCPINERSASQGSGTVIDSIGTILTNKHVVAGTLGCLVGFIDDFDDEPYFGERQIADIIKTSPTEDIAILRIRNPKNKKLPYVNTTKSISNFSLGTQITTYGYPAQFGRNITYTSGDFSGVDENYLKTTAILEHGNSGGGAYLKDGTFIGIPSAAVKGELNSLGYILSINAINGWLGNSSIAFGNSNNNQYSRVSVLEDIDLNTLDSLNLFIPETDEAGNITAPAQIGFFPDVPESHPNAVAVEVLRERNIIQGYPDGTFKPENTVNRAELLKILVEGKIGKPDENQYKNCFPDVATEWFAPYVCYAKSEGWVEGYPDGNFKPEQTVNKVEALKMLINSQGIETSDAIGSKPFNDVDTTFWFAKYVVKAKELEILEETGSIFNPDNGMKRAGISENLYRLLTQ